MPLIETFVIEEHVEDLGNGNGNALDLWEGIGSPNGGDNLLSYSAPVAYLFAEHVAVELRPSLTIAFRSGPSPNDVHLWLSTSLMWR